MVLAAAKEEAAKVLRKRAADDGTDLKTAGQAIVAERDKAADKKVDDEKKAAERLAKQQADERLKAAKESAPGIEKVIQEGLKNGMSEGDIFAQLKDRFGGEVAGRLVGEGSADAKKDMINDMLNPEKGEVSKSQTVGAASFADKIQGGVSNEANKKMQEQIQKLTAIQQVLKDIHDKGGVVFKK